MSEQAKILAEMQTMIMRIIKSGSATPEESDRIDALEASLFQQKSYQEIEHDEYDYIGEEIAALLAANNLSEATEKLCANDITVEDFFDFIEYHDEDEEYSETFTPTFKAEVKKIYQAKC